MSTVIEVHNLSKSYTKLFKRSRIQAVQNVSFAVRAGQVFGFLGPNGSGKTTTIGMLLDIINRTAGEIRLFGNADLNAARKRIGATLETPNFYPYLSGLDNLKIVASIKGCSGERIQETLRLVKLEDRQRDKFKSYSLGMKQRLALASALLSDPELIILDEPANGLDPEGIREIREVIRGLGRQGKTVFLSSHLLDEVEQICTHVAVIKKGVIVAEGSVKELTSKRSLTRLQSDNIETLKQAVERYPSAQSVTVRREAAEASVYAELTDSDTAALNRFLTQNGVYVSHLSQVRQTLEEVFLELTQ